MSGKARRALILKGTTDDSSFPRVEDPIETLAVERHCIGMNILLLVVVLLLLFGGGGFFLAVRPSAAVGLAWPC